MGFIYKIVIGEDLYIGSTKNKYLCNRQSTHNAYYKKDCNKLLYKKCKEYNIEKIKCILLEEVDNENIKIKEQEYINKLNPSLNVRKAYNTIEEQKEYIKIKDKKYYEKNKDKIKKNREKYYEKNKEKNKEKIKCDLCGSIVSKGSLKKHQSRMICRKMWDSSLLFTDDEE